MTFLENGIYEKQLEWIQNLNQAVFQVKQKEPAERENVVLTMQMTIGVFVVYLVGIGISIVSFLMELTYAYMCPRIIPSHIFNSKRWRRRIRQFKNRFNVKA